MTRGQIAQLQELRKCYIATQGERAVYAWIAGHESDEKLSPGEKAWLRRLWHAYRGQIAAMRKNRARL
jgi:hypothetical protein